MKIHSPIPLLALAYISSQSIAQEFPDFPSFADMHGLAGNPKSLILECRKDNTASGTGISCDITERSVTTPLSEAEINARSLTHLEDMQALSDEEFLKQFEEICRGATRGSDWRQLRKEATTESAKVLIDIFEEIAQVDCLKISKPEANSFLLRVSEVGAEMERETCKIKTYRRGETFKPQHHSSDSHYWISSNLPVGECGKLRLSTLKRDPESKYFWDYETREIQMNTDVESDWICDELEPPTKYTWSARTHPLTCSSIIFD